VEEHRRRRRLQLLLAEPRFCDLIHPHRVMRERPTLAILARRSKGGVPMFMRRRPLMRAAMVGGGAYYAGKKVQQGRGRDAEQEARLEQLEAQQAAPAPVAAAPPGGITDNTIEQLKKLGELHDSGVLTDAEFEAQKQKLLAG
jgi:hypothetical protein